MHDCKPSYKLSHSNCSCTIRNSFYGCAANSTISACRRHLLPLKRVVKEPDPPHHQDQEVEDVGVEPEAMRPGLEPDVARAMEQERPYQDYVESEVREFWRQISKARSLTKPTQSDIRSAAMPILVQRLRRRKGSEKYVYPSIALRAVADVVQHAREQGWAERFYWRVYASPFYIDALIQLADDAGWLPREIPLPYHGGPSHPPIYHTIDWRKDCAVPVPMEDSLLRGEYVHTHAGHRITPVPYIRPWQELSTSPSETELLNRGWSACYLLRSRRRCLSVWVEIFWLEQMGDDIVLRNSKLEELFFTCQP